MSPADTDSNIPQQGRVVKPASTRKSGSTRKKAATQGASGAKTPTTNKPAPKKRVVKKAAAPETPATKATSVSQAKPITPETPAAKATSASQTKPITPETRHQMIALRASTSA